MPKRTDLYGAVAVASLIASVHAIEDTAESAVAFIKGIKEKIVDAAHADGIDTNAGDSALAALVMELDAKRGDLADAMLNDDASVPVPSAPLPSGDAPAAADGATKGVDPAAPTT